MRSAVRPLQREQVIGAVDIVVEVYPDAVFEQAGLQADIKLAGALAGYFLVTDVIELCGGGHPEILADAEGGASSIVADVVVAAKVPSGLQEKIIDKAEC